MEGKDLAGDAAKLEGGLKPLLGFFSVSPAGRMGGNKDLPESVAELANGF